MGNDYRCPRCHSRAVMGYPEIRCSRCGWSEPLLDYPISWNCHQSYCRGYGCPDPGANEPAQYTIEDVHDRLGVLEERIEGLSNQELRGLQFARIKENIEQLRLGLRYTQRQLGEMARKRAERSVTRIIKPRTTEV